MKENESIVEICDKCGASCCKLGGAVASELEYKAIIEAGYPDYFKKVGKGVFHTIWKNDGICPYLIGNKCSVYEVRPFGCRSFPVLQMYERGIYLVRCPLAPKLSERIIEERKQVLSQRPKLVVEKSANDLIKHSKTLEMRLSKFELQLL